eukprot:COSAG01_NODE_1273_length_10951_cov_3.439182_3_plen_287_part_01
MIVQSVGVCLEDVRFGEAFDNVTIVLLEGNTTDASRMLPPDAKFNMQFLASMIELLLKLQVTEVVEDYTEDGTRCNNSVGSYECHCAAGWEGVNCAADIDECASTPCFNGATCTHTIGNYSCACAHGWTDSNCTTQCNPCTGNCPEFVDNCDPNFAFCIHTAPARFECECMAGYESTDGGVNCTEIDECRSKPCQQEVHGTVCHDFIDRYNCSCARGFLGFNCEINVDECASGPCVRGTCVDGIAAYNCSCPPGWEGHNCAVDIDECRSQPCRQQSSVKCEDSTTQP